MTPQVFPITYTAVDWRLIRTVLPGLLNRSPLRAMDAMQTKMGQPVAYLQLLDAFRNPNSRPGEAIRSALHTRRAFEVGFLVSASAQAISELGRDFEGSTILAAEGNVMILTGNLAQWQSFIPVGSEMSNLESRQVIAQIFSFFDALGMRELWSKFQKKDNGDGTFLLEGR